MQVVRQRIINRIDIRIGQQLFVRTVSARNRKFARGRFRLGAIARSDGGDFSELALLHGRNYFDGGDARHAEHSPTNLA